MAFCYTCDLPERRGAGPVTIILGLNPITGVVEGFRWALLGIGETPRNMIYASMGVSFLRILVS